jgi:hypothetical protein
MAGLAFLFLLVLVFAFSPVFATYAHHDDFVFLMPQPYGKYFQHELMWALGRIVGDWIVYVFHFLTHVRSDFTLVRCLSILFLSISAALFYQSIRSYFSRRIDAFLFVCIAFTLPPFQAIVQWGCAMYETVGLVFALAAGHCALKGFAERRYWPSFIFLMLALLTYQPAAMFYWVIVAVMLLLDRRREAGELWRQIVFFAGIGIAALGCYAFILMTVCRPYRRFLTDAYDPFMWTDNLGAKFSWFFHEALYNAINLWTIFPTTGFVKLSLLCFAAGGAAVLIKAVRDRNRLNWTHILGAAGALGAVFVLVDLPSLLNTQPMALYRTGLGLTTLFCLLWLWTLRGLLNWLPQRAGAVVMTVILCLVLSVNIHQSVKHIRYFRVLPSQIEWNYAVKVLSKNDLRQYEEILLIQPAGTKFDRYDEFGVFTTFYKQDVLLFINAALKESGKRGEARHIKQISIILPDEKRNPAGLLLDMRLAQKVYEQTLSGLRSGGL